MSMPFPCTSKSGGATIAPFALSDADTAPPRGSDFDRDFDRAQIADLLAEVDALTQAAQTDTAIIPSFPVTVAVRTIGAHWVNEQTDQHSIALHGILARGPNYDAAATKWIAAAKAHLDGEHGVTGSGPDDAAAAAWLCRAREAGQ